MQHPNKHKTKRPSCIATRCRVFACITLMILIQFADAALGRRIIFQSGALYEAADLLMIARRYSIHFVD